jgi:hypothetical protein
MQNSNISSPEEAEQYLRKIIEQISKRFTKHYLSPEELDEYYM